MGYLAERVSYLRGLVDGISLDKSSPESRIFDEILELFEDIVTSVEAIDEKQDALTEELEYTREDVDALFYDEDFEDEDDEDDDEDDYDDYEEEEYYDEFECPNCGEILPVDEALLDTEDEITLTCPGCGEKVTISFVDDEEDEEDDEDFECDGDCENCPEGDDELPF